MVSTLHQPGTTAHSWYIQFYNSVRRNQNPAAIGGGDGPGSLRENVNSAGDRYNQRLGSSQILIDAQTSTISIGGSADQILIFRSSEKQQGCRQSKNSGTRIKP